jgi:hypothetical protein
MRRQFFARNSGAFSLCGKITNRPYFRNIDAIHRINAITTITEIMPTAAPALNIPLITSQLLKQSINKKKTGKYNFFMIA